MTPRGEGGTTVGVAVPVPEPWGEQLRRARLGFGEEQAWSIPTHITLLPPTALRAPELPALRDHLARVAGAHQPFEVVLRGTGTFRPVSQVVYVQVAQGVAPCEQLERQIRCGPVRPRRSFPYHPHVTVAHDLPGEVLDRAFAELAAFSCGFEARSFTMYLHDGDKRWRSAAEYPLDG